MLLQLALEEFRLVSVFILFWLAVFFLGSVLGSVLGLVLIVVIEFWELASSTLSENKLSEFGCVELA